MEMTTSNKEEREIDIQGRSLSPYEKLMLKKIESMNLIEPGKLVKQNEVEAILDCKYVDKDDMVFTGKYIKMKELIESKGYFITQAGLKSCEFRILKTNEMAEHGWKKLCKASKNIFKVNYILKIHDHSHLEGREEKIYNNILDRAATIALSHQKMLLKNKFFNSKQLLNDLT